jgi:archaellum component FlaF (FlaF/FlaG flagellin family)
VQFGTKSTTSFTATATTITVNVPEGATRGRVMAVSPTGTAMAAQIFTVTAPEAPAP